MNSTLTIRLPKAHRLALKRRAAALKKTESDLVRELIVRESEQRFAFENVGHLAGILRGSQRRATDWRRHLRAANWRK